jgi:hypothetical protein
MDGELTCSVCTHPWTNRVKNVLRGENPARPKIKHGGNDASTLNGPTSHPPDQIFHTICPHDLQVLPSQPAKQKRKSTRIGR